MHHYLSRMRGTKIRQQRHNLSWILWSWLGGFVGIGLVGYANLLVDLPAKFRIFLVGSLGASAVLIYGTPHVPYAQPRNLVGGHLLSALTGVAVVQLTNLPLELQAALAVSGCIAIMHLTDTLHPPGGASALIAVIGGEPIRLLGWSYAFAPVLLSVLVMLSVAVLINNLSSDPERHYPKRWL